MSFMPSFPPGNNEDDDFGSLPTNSNLASLFHHESVSSNSSQKSLVYSAPRQPVVRSPAPPSQVVQNVQPQLNILAASAVNCYKLTNDKYEAILGKLGLALLGNHDSCIYQLILYKNKQTPIANVKITSSFTLTSQPDNFCSFYDDQRQNWAVLFDSKEMAKKFTNKIDDVKIKLANVKEAEKPVKEKVTEILPESSIQKKDASENSARAKLISRVAKMGQPILPLSGAFVAHNSDSETLKSSPEPESEPVGKTRKSRSLSSSKHSEPYVNSSTLMMASQPGPMTNMNAYPMMPMGYNTSYVPTMNVVSSSHFDTLLSENRTNNSEVRMHLCRLTDKVDQLANKIGPSNDCQAGTADVSKEVLVHCQALQRDSALQNSKLDLILDWIRASPSIADQVADQEKRLEKLLSDKVGADQESCSRMKQLQADKDELEAKHSQLLAQMHVSERSREKQAEQRDCQLAEARTKLDALELRLRSAEERSSSLSRQLDQMERDKVQCENDVASLRHKLEQSERQLAVTQQPKADTQPSNEHVMKIMNKVYKEIVKQFRPEDMYPFRTIKSTVSQIIRDVTLAMLNDKEAPADDSRTNGECGQPNEPGVGLESGDVVDVPGGTSEHEQQQEQQRPPQHEPPPEPDVVESPCQDEGAVRTPDKTGRIEEDAAKGPSTPASDDDKCRSVSLLESLTASLEAARSQASEQAWKPEPPPPPLIDDFDDDWLM